MATSGRNIVQNRQATPHPLPWLQPFEEADRPVTAYAQDYRAGYRTTLHTHPRAQLLWAVQGAMRVETPAALFTLPPLRALWLPPALPHAVVMLGPVAMRALFVRPDAATALASAPVAIGVAPLLRELILRLVHEGPDWCHDGAGPALSDLILRELAIAPRLQLGLPALSDPRLCRLANALLENPADTRTLEQWALAAGASPRTLERAFQREAGMGFARWRTAARLDAAVPLLAAGAKLDRVAHKVGYASASSFAAAWRAAFGTTPGRAVRAG